MGGQRHIRRGRAVGDTRHRDVVVGRASGGQQGEGNILVGIRHHAALNHWNGRDEGRGHRVPRHIVGVVGGQPVTVRAVGGETRRRVLGRAVGQSLWGAQYAPGYLGHHNVLVVLIAAEIEGHAGDVQIGVARELDDGGGRRGRRCDDRRRIRPVQDIVRGDHVRIGGARSEIARIHEGGGVHRLDQGAARGLPIDDALDRHIVETAGVRKRRGNVRGRHDAVAGKRHRGRGAHHGGGEPSREVGGTDRIVRGDHIRVTGVGGESGARVRVHDLTAGLGDGAGIYQDAIDDAAHANISRVNGVGKGQLGLGAGDGHAHDGGIGVDRDGWGRGRGTQLPDGIVRADVIAVRLGRDQVRACGVMVVVDCLARGQTLVSSRDAVDDAGDRNVVKRRRTEKAHGNVVVAGRDRAYGDRRRDRDVRGDDARTGNVSGIVGDHGITVFDGGSQRSRVGVHGLTENTVA